jgi:hypothetical protein
MVEVAKPLPKPEDDAGYVEEFSYLDNGEASLQRSTYVDPSSIARPVDDLDTLARGAGLDEQAVSDPVAITVDLLTITDAAAVRAKWAWQRGHQGFDVQCRR